MREIATTIFGLEEGLCFLNHGSFGSTPRAIARVQQALREELERNPIRFMLRELPERIDRARTSIAAFLKADPAGLCRVNNATEGVNAVLMSWPFAAGDRVLITRHGYGACNKAALHWSRRAGAEPLMVDFPFRGASPELVVERVVEAAKRHRPKLAIVDHITSPTGLVLPVEKIVPELEALGCAVLVDGAHAPGMLDLDLDALGASYYTGNLHKWCCAPKGAAVLWVREDRREGLHPVCISHGYGLPATPQRSALHLEFDWLGTDDPTAWLAAPDSIRFLGELEEGGWAGLRDRNRKLALHARAALCEAIGRESPTPDSMLGSLSAIELPPGPDGHVTTPFAPDPLQDRLLFDHRIEVPIVPWSDASEGGGGGRLVRVSAAVYNDETDYDVLIDALRKEGLLRTG